ncbi:MAG: hypothetical protein GY874_09385 [Desulfobacteraceae bacterium]|nr:hypothetical protein [Desulfobacteraceae bacterium]
MIKTTFSPQSIFIRAAIFFILITSPLFALEGIDIKQTINQWSPVLEDYVEREFYIHIPVNYDITTPTPLVLNFHGYADNAVDQADRSGFNLKSDESGFIVVNVEGYQVFSSSHLNWAGRSWNAKGLTTSNAASDHGLDDAALAVDIVNYISAHQELFNIDSSRVYAHGYSNGAGLVHTIAIEASDVFAAVTSISCNTLITENEEPPAPKRAIPVLTIVGLNDLVIPYCGGFGIFKHQWTYSSEESIEFWRIRNKCDNSFVTEMEGFEDKWPGLNGQWTLSEPAKCKTTTGPKFKIYNNCDDNAMTGLVTLYGNEPWSFGHNLYGYNNENVNIADLSWTWMSQFTNELKK